MYNSSHLARMVPNTAAAFKKSPFTSNRCGVTTVVQAFLPVLRKRNNCLKDAEK